MAKHVPANWPAVVPRIAVDEPKALFGFIQDVFGAVGEFHPDRPSELRIGDSLIMVGSTIEREPMPAFLYVYVEDADTVFRHAVDRGAKSLEEPRDMPYGDRRAMVRDPWGNTWQIATHRGRFTPQLVTPRKLLACSRGEGDFIFIPRNTVHGPIIEKGQRFAALSVFAPFFDRSKPNIDWERDKP